MNSFDADNFSHGTGLPPISPALQMRSGTTHESAVSTGESRHVTPIAGVPDFWERVRRAPHRLLAIDYDGTLAPFRVARERAVPLEGAKEALVALHRLKRTDLAILSGRPAFQVLELLGRDLPIPIFGAHGYEVVHPDGRTESFQPTNHQEEGLTKAIALTIDAGYAEQLERKSASVALHTRGLPNPEEVEKRFLNLWAFIAIDHQMDMMHFNRGVELRARGRNKGTALAGLLTHMPPGTFPVYIGDDTTDEDAFRAVKSLGVGIKVGAGSSFTEASGRVPDEAAVLNLLRDWLHVAAES